MQHFATTKNSFAACVALIGLACLLRCWNLGQSFWWDEIWSTLAYARADSLWQTLSGLGYYFNNHVLYSLACRASIRVFGATEVAARMPALLLGLAGIPVLYRLASRRLDATTGLAAAYLLAISAFHIDHSSEARGYSGLMLFSLLSSMLFVSAVRHNRSRDWAGYAACTFLGFYLHVFMIAVALVQCFCMAAMLVRPGAATPGRHITLLKRYGLYTACAAILTLAAYAPILRAFFVNMGKVSTVESFRLPFVLDMLSALYPGIASPAGALVYGPLLIIGLLTVYRADSRRNGGFEFFYTVALLTLPLALYCIINPMFIFERYFIFMLPFAMLILSAGMTRACRMLPAIPLVRYGCLCVLAAGITLMQLPALRQIVADDRQNYREAVRFVEQSDPGLNRAYLFSIGYAGPHFNYYARHPVQIPATFAEFAGALGRYDAAWCLITAWLPEMRPPRESELLYREDPEHEKIHRYVLEHFTLAKDYDTKFPTRVYRLEK